MIFMLSQSIQQADAGRQATTWQMVTAVGGAEDASATVSKPRIPGNLSLSFSQCPQSWGG